MRRPLLLVAVAVLAGCAGGTTVTTPDMEPASAAPPRVVIPLNEDGGQVIGPFGLRVGTYVVVDDSANDVNPPDAAVQLSQEERLDASQRMGYGDDGTWCGWWVGNDPDGVGSVVLDTVANDDDLVSITESMIGLSIWGDCVFATG